MAKKNLVFEEINPMSPTITGALGISDEREQVVKEFIFECAEKDAFTSTSDALSKVSAVCETPQELAFFAFQLGRMSK